MDPNNIVVGDEGCTVSDIIEIIHHHPDVNILLDKYNELSRKLSILPAERGEYFKLLLLHKKKPIDIIERILITWSTKKGPEATLAVLFTALDKCDCAAIIDVIRAGLQKQPV